MRAYFDCRAGISGDMALAALCHLGLDVAELQQILLEAGMECRLTLCSECRTAGPGLRVELSLPQGQSRGQTSGSSCLPSPRNMADMATIMQKVQVSPTVSSSAMATLTALVAAHAHARQIAPQEVHFTEGRGLDILVFVLGVAWGLESLGVQGITASPLPWFSGTVTSDQCLLPLPAPATAYLLQGKPVFSTAASTELITPTGAALVHTLIDDFADGPQGRLGCMGTGYGLRPHAAGLRIWLLEEDAAPVWDDATALCQRVLLLESHVDHLTGEELGAALEALIAVPEVLDVLWLPGMGKKNRPAGALRVLCLPEHAVKVRSAFFVHTHTLGVRCQELERWILPRHYAALPADQGGFAVKAYSLQGHKWLRPECDVLKEAAAKQGLGLPGLRIPREKK